MDERDLEQMAGCGCEVTGLPRDVTDLAAPLFQACGGRLYRILLETKASAVAMGDGSSVETRINTLERALAANTTTRFAENIAGRDKLGNLIAGDRCYVFDASADPAVSFGGAMYIWLPSRSWYLLYMGQSPIDVINLIVEKGGLVAEDNRLKVDFSQMSASDLARLLGAIVNTGGGLSIGGDGKIRVDFSKMSNAELKALIGQILDGDGGLGTDNNGKIRVETGAGLGKDANGKLTIACGKGLGLADNRLIFNNGKGLVVDSGNNVNVDFSTVAAVDLKKFTDSLVGTTGGIVTDANGKLRVDTGSGLALTSGKVVFKNGAGLSVDASNNVNVDFSAMPGALMKNVVLSMVKPNSGLAVDATTGQLYVDFDTMPADKIREIQQAIRVPIWVDASTKQFYVNNQTGSDTYTRGDGRGLSAAKPFASIGECAKYICENYNIADQVVYINITKTGTPYGRATLPTFSRTSGLIFLRTLGDPASVADWAEIEASTSEDDWSQSDPVNMSCLSVTGGYWRLANLKLNMKVTIAPSRVVTFSNMTVTNATLDFSSLAMTITDSLSSFQNQQLANIVAQSNAIVGFNQTPATSAGVSMAIISSQSTYGIGLSVWGGSQISINGSPSAAQKPIQVSGKYSVFASVSNATINAGDFACDRTFAGTLNDEAKRYQAKNGGKIIVNGKGQNFFPGTVDGTVEASTYSFYAG